MNTSKSLIKQFNYDTLVSKAHLIIMNHDGEVLLVKNEEGHIAYLLQNFYLKQHLRIRCVKQWKISGTLILEP
ncbi:hypothetical protein G7059_02180 [Erysipelothrix sp. HDW6A]|uniref:hypothetical protein n=1 Tax=Erysipelothrix sp. HDW6A TaxID=2714928 RepID=UPI00140C02D5|nr:hypothetical protein [Erysipelothrix sp. HDW6A]QIK56740.1 hypothetical protein G7059_02180 [Erysipelothrix sp. HDW6A]